MIRALALTLAVGVAGCGGQTQYAARIVAPGELTLRYDEKMVIYAGHERLTEGPRYDGLDHYVRCVPTAYEHARYARKHGRARRGLAWAGGTLGVASLGSLGGLALFEENRSAAFGILGIGLGVAVLGIVLAGASRSAGNQAHGNAIDAMNYYNDAVGSLGGSCDRPLAPPTPAPAPTPAPTPTVPVEATPEGPIEGPPEATSETTTGVTTEAPPPVFVDQRP